MNIILMGESLCTNDQRLLAADQAGTVPGSRRLWWSLDIEHELAQAVSLITTLFSKDNYSEARKMADQYCAMYRYYVSGLPQLLLFWHLGLLYGKAYLYSRPGSDEGPRMIHEVIDEMKKSKYNRIPSAWNKRSREEFKRLLGLAYHLLGYHFYVNEFDPEQGIQHSRSALAYYLAIEDEEGVATILDNQARMFAMKGDEAQARANHHCALIIRVAHRHNSQYRLALSVISGAWINMKFGHLDKAEFQLEQALRRCEQEGRLRGLGLTYFAYGYLYWLRAAQAGRNRQERWNFLHRALDYLRKAEYIFKAEVEEPERLIEATYALGCVYRDMAASRRPVEPKAAMGCQHSADWHFKEARRLAKNHLPTWHARINAEMPTGWAV